MLLVGNSGETLSTLCKLDHCRRHGIDECEARGQGFLLGVFDEQRLAMEVDGISLGDKLESEKLRHTKKQDWQIEIVDRVLAARKAKLTFSDGAPLVEAVMKLESAQLVSTGTVISRLIEQVAAAVSKNYELPPSP